MGKGNSSGEFKRDVMRPTTLSKRWVLQIQNTYASTEKLYSNS
jgi:hypothetical protein